jgi:glyoxylase-like metal-dependent hydrolase (beta-lactamase superfamily II)
LFSGYTPNKFLAPILTAKGDKSIEIVPNVHLIPGIIANPYLIIDSGKLTLIDAGMPGSHKKILRYIAGLGYTPKDLKHILITHADFDHVGGLAAIQTATGAYVYAHAIEAVAMAAGCSSRKLKPGNVFAKLLFGIMGRLFKAAPVQVDELLTDGQTFPVLGGLHVLETSGHTPGHLSFFAPSAGILFVGDSIMSEKSGLRGSHGANNWDQSKSDESMRKQAALGARIVCSGHGPVVMDAVGKFPQI